MIMKTGKKKIMLSVLLAFAVTLAAAGCGNTSPASPENDSLVSDPSLSVLSGTTGSIRSAGSSSDASSASSETSSDTEPLKVGISMPDESYAKSAGSALEKDFSDAGYDVTVSYAGADSGKQDSDVRSLIADEVQLLIVSPVDGADLKDALSGAADADIPVIGFDRLIEDSDAVQYDVSFSSYESGVLEAQYIADTLGLDLSDTSKKFNIELFAGQRDDREAGLAFNGAYDTLSPYIDAGILNIPSGQTTFSETSFSEDSRSAAAERMQSILSAYYADGTPLHAVLCTGDPAALGVTDAVDSGYKGSDPVLITGAGCGEENLANLTDGKQSMDLFCPYQNEITVTRDLGLSILSGHIPDASLIDDSGWDFGCTYDTETFESPTGIIPSYLITPETVTAGNLQTVLIDPGYYTLDEDGPPKPAA